MFAIHDDDLTGEQTRALLALHLAGMHANTPPGNVFALDLSALEASNVSVWSAWAEDRIVSIGALKMLSADWAEIKSMRTHPDFLRKGAARAMLDHIVETARARGVHRLSLETGSGPAFEPALALYRTHGFAHGEAFGDYVATDFNQFLHLEVPRGRPLRPPQRLDRGRDALGQVPGPAAEDYGRNERARRGRRPGRDG